MIYLPTDEIIKEQIIYEVREERDFVLMEMSEYSHDYSLPADLLMEHYYRVHKSLTDRLLLLTTI